MSRFMSKSSFAIPVLTRAALLCGGIVCLAAPAAAQLVTSLPFGQSNSMVTPLPFGQRSHSPLRPLVSRASSVVVAQWNMTETSGTTMTDSSGNNNNGTLYNVQTTGSGYVFNGTTSKVIVPNSASLNPGTSDFTYTAHVQTSALPPVGGNYDVIRKGAADTIGGGFRMEIQNSDGVGVAYCSVSDSTKVTLSIRGKTNVVDGQPHTLSCQKTSTGLTLVVDSLAPRTKSGTLGSVSNAKPLLIGVKAPNITTTTGDWYNGTLNGITMSVGS